MRQEIATIKAELTQLHNSLDYSPRLDLNDIQTGLGLPEELHDTLIEVRSCEGIELIENYAKETNGMGIDRSDLSGFVRQATDGTVQCTSITQHIPQSLYSGI